MPPGGAGDGTVEGGAAAGAATGGAETESEGRLPDLSGLPAVDSRSVGVGAAVGTGTFVASFLLAYLVFVVDVVALQGAAGIGAVLPWAAVELSVGGGSVTTGVWALVGLFALEGQFVPLSVGGSATSLFGAADGFLTLPYRLLPVVVLAAGGAAVARQRGAETPGGGAVAGGALALGYLPLLAMLAVAVGATSDVQPSVLVAALVGLGLPLVVGAAAGAAVGAVGGGDADPESPSGGDADRADPKARDEAVAPGPASEDPPQNRGDAGPAPQRAPQERPRESSEGERPPADRPTDAPERPQREASDRSDDHSEWDPR